VGLLAGYGGVALTVLIDWIHRFFFVYGKTLFAFLGTHYLFILPALGGLIVGPIIVFVSPETRGHGVPEVMQAMLTAGGRIRARVAAIKVLVSSITIGSGGSAGREGPIVQVGATVGSSLGQLLQLPSQRINTLIACGSAGGIAAAFNAPIGGVLFALEVILNDFSAEAFGLVVLSSVTSSVVARSYLGSHPAFPVPAYEFSISNWWELVLFMLLGVLAGLLARAYIWLLYAAEDTFESLKRLPAWCLPALGGLVVGGMGVIFPQILGVGYDQINKALIGEVALTSALLLMVAKLLATSFTLGSGGSGGVFAPGFFMGSMLGVAFGKFVNMLLPGLASPPGAYALVGMGSVFAAAAHAPLTNVIMLFEMSGDYRMILPMMVGVVTSTLLIRKLSRQSIYTLKLARRGILTSQRRPNPMRTLTVGETMSADVETLAPDTTVREAADKLLAGKQTAFPITDNAGNLVGIITHGDVEKPILDGMTELPIIEVGTEAVLTCFPDETLEQALARMAANSVSRLVVVDRLNPTRPIGMLTRKDIIDAYTRAMKEYSRVDPRLRRLMAGRATTRVIEFTVDKGSPFAGVKVADLKLPPHCLLVLVERGRRLIIPKGDLKLEVGDHITLLTTRASAEVLLSRIRKGLPLTGDD